MRARLAVVVAVMGAAALAPRSALAYSLASGFTVSCHERITLAAFTVLIDQLDESRVVLPAQDLWRKVADELASSVIAAPEQAARLSLTPQQQFVLASAAIGVRAPDTGGHSVSNLSQLRRAQIDPDAAAQHVHCLRGPKDDGFAGDLATLRGAEQLVRDELAAAATAAAQSGSARNRVTPLYLDFYGQISVEVDGAAYHVGRALHTIQDAYSHAVRSGDGRTVLSVLNYIDPVSGHEDTARDGLAHSDTLDACERAELAPLVERAAVVSVAVARAAVVLIRGADQSLLNKGFAPCAPGEPDVASCEWLHYLPACADALARGPAAAEASCCSAANGYCASPWLSIAKEKLTQPYVKTVLGCAVAGPGTRPSAAVVLFAAALAVLVARRRRIAVLTCLLVAPLARAADPGDRGFVLDLEGHGSLLSDVPERSFIEATLGFAVRGGYRWGRWGLLAHVERNHWLPTELSRSWQPGALNLGVGAERLAAGGLVRLSAVAGPSILWFDTALDEAGTVGLFVDLRPAGLRWSLFAPIALTFDPLSVAVVAPVLSTPGIKMIEYRTLIGLELTWPPLTR